MQITRKTGTNQEVMESVPLAEKRLEAARWFSAPELALTTPPHSFPAPFLPCCPIEFPRRSQLCQAESL